MTIKIITDSGADAFVSSIESVAHQFVPLTIRAGSSSWIDYGKLNIPEFVTTLKQTKMNGRRLLVPVFTTG